MEAELNTIQKEIEELRDRLDGIAAKSTTFGDYLQKSKSIRTKLGNLVMERNLLLVPEMTEFSDLDKECLMPIDKFIAYCKSGAFIDDDGFGNYATENQVSDIEVYPSHIMNNKYRKDFTHVCWYNR